MIAVRSAGDRKGYYFQCPAELAEKGVEIVAAGGFASVGAEVG